jgi:hypothetical protein
MNKKKDNIQGKAFFTNGFKFKGVKYEAMTNGRLGILIQVNSAFINGGNKLRAVYDAAFVLKTSYDDLEEIITEGNFNKEVIQFMDTFDYEDTFELEKLICNITEEIQAVMVETRNDEDDEDIEDGKK